MQRADGQKQKRQARESRGRGRAARRFLLLCGLLALCGGLPRRALGCASCGCGDPTLTAMGVEKPFRNRIRLALEERLGAHIAGAVAERNLVSRTTLSVSWAPWQWLTVGATAPLVVVRTDLPGSATRHTVGFGDMEFLARGIVFRDRKFSPRHLVGTLLGVKAPTGPRRTDSTGYPAPDDLQPGTGSWDAIFGLSYGYFGSTVSAFAAVSYRLTTPGYQGFRRGSALVASGALQFAVTRGSALSLGVDLSHTRANQIAGGIATPDSGGLLVSLSPAVLVSLRTDWLLRAGVQVPVLSRWLGVQAETPTAVVGLIVDL